MGLSGTIVQSVSDDEEGGGIVNLNDALVGEVLSPRI